MYSKFLRATVHSANRVIATAIPSVRPSVRLYVTTASKEAQHKGDKTLSLLWSRLQSKGFRCPWGRHTTVAISGIRRVGTINLNPRPDIQFAPATNDTYPIMPCCTVSQYTGTASTMAISAPITLLIFCVHINDSKPDTSTDNRTLNERRDSDLPSAHSLLVRCFSLSTSELSVRTGARHFYHLCKDDVTYYMFDIGPNCQSCL